MELVLAIAALHRRQRLVSCVLHRVANEALLNAFELTIDVRLPLQDRCDDVAVARLQEVADAQGPLTHLGFFEGKLVPNVDLD